ncbi:MAG: glycosyltransferase family 2 protein [Candidatus Neomarinimicrobiota bacterium]|nr:MAG: glycosyltransferase family 2 protein [Candidatus Neomarinimicrobiota bacterium]
MFGSIIKIINIFNYVVFIYFITLNIWYFTLNIIAYRGLKKYMLRLQVVHPNDKLIGRSSPPVTLLSPAYNESENCIGSIKSQLKIQYPDMRIIFINDGSTDDTLEKMIVDFEMVPSFLPQTSFLETQKVIEIYQSTIHPNLWLIDKENGKKADALNVGINYCQTALFCAIDNDSMLEQESISRVVIPFIEDTRTIVSGGIIRIANGCTFEDGQIKKVDLPKNILARFQVMEYLRAFYGGRLAWEMLDASLIVSGAFGVFRHSIVVAAGGYRHSTIGEDMELIVRLHKYCGDNKIPYRIRYIPDPIAWTEGPTSLRTLGKQRDRWQRGLLDSILSNITMLFRPKYKKVGMLAMPFYFIYEMLGPLIEIMGYLVFFFLILIGHASTVYVVAFLLVAIVLGMCLSVFSLVLEELSFHRYPKISHLFTLMGVAVIENIGYRQLNSWWRIKGTWSFMKKNKNWY